MAAPEVPQRGIRRPPQERTILVADRDELTRTATVAILQRLNFHVVEADSSRSALGHASRGPFSCVILDLNLVETGAFELCRRLLAKAGWGWTPVIFTSGRPPRTDLRMDMLAGGFDYLCKPFRADQLLACVGDALASAGDIRAARPDRELVLSRAESAVGS
jgi:DNA-binding response OmpR family regulator